MLFIYVEIKTFATDDQFTVGALGVVSCKELQPYGSYWLYMYNGIDHLRCTFDSKWGQCWEIGTRFYDTNIIHGGLEWVFVFWWEKCFPVCNKSSKDIYILMITIWTLVYHIWTYISIQSLTSSTSRSRSLLSARFTVGVCKLFRFTKICNLQLV